MAQQELHSAQILRSPVDQRGFSASHGMGSVGRVIEAELLDPAVQDTGVLTSADMCRVSSTAREQVILGLQMSLADPGLDSLASRCRDLELHWSLGLRCNTQARAATRSLWQTSRTSIDVRSHARSLLSMPRLKSASSRVRSSIRRRIRIAQISLGLNGAFWPTSLALFHGSRRCRDDCVSMRHLPFHRKPKADDSASVAPGPGQAAWAHAYAMKSQPAGFSPTTPAARSLLGLGPLHALTGCAAAR
jgi:hypothetical protein